MQSIHSALVRGEGSSCPAVRTPAVCEVAATVTAAQVVVAAGLCDPIPDFCAGVAAAAAAA